ncbi:hypothetical protein AHAS_Ahas16G0137900 [Arachis hypogaea]
MDNRVRRGRENASSQCSSTRRYGAEVTHAILPGKARTTFNKRCRKVKEVGDLMTGEPATEAPVNGGRNYNGPKVAKFLVGLSGMDVLIRTHLAWCHHPWLGLSQFLDLIMKQALPRLP